MRLGKQDATDALGKIPLFAGLNRKHLEFLSSRTTQVDLTEGSDLVEQGVMGRDAMVIISGTAVATRDGDEIATLGPGDVVGEMSLINHVPRTATVTATSDVTVLVMNSGEFTEVLEANSEVMMAILQTVVARLAHDEEI